jgi:biopolymer transport protein ExbD
MSRLRRHKTRINEEAELNITAFLNLMVVLVPFLLISAVFSQVAVLELNTPDPNQQTPPKKENEEKKEKVEVIIRQDVIEVNNGFKIALEIPRDEEIEGGFDYAKLTEYLREAKVRMPDRLTSVVLLEADVQYERLISVMDRLKVDAREDDNGQIKQYELFPTVAIGDAPATSVVTR